MSEQETLDKIRSLLAEAKPLAATVKAGWRTEMTRQLNEAIQEGDEAAEMLGVMRRNDESRTAATQSKAGA